MSAHHDHEYLELAAGYALDCLDPGDRERFEAHLATGCPVCEAELETLRSAAVALASSAPPAMPSPGLRERVLAAAREDRGGAAEATAPRRAGDGDREGLFSGGPGRGKVVEMRPRTRSWMPALGWAAAAALAIVTALSWNAANRTRAELDATREQLAGLRQQLEVERRWAAVMNSPDARVTELAPVGVTMRGRAVFDPRTRSAVLVFENSTPPAGKDYELWALRPDGVASLGLVRPDATGHAVLRLENVGDAASVAGFAVTMEQEGGSGNPSAPGGPIVLAGRFGAE